MLIVLIGKLTTSVDFPDNIIHIERTSNQSVLKKYYQSANILLNPTLDDNYPTVNLEAQACGCKVLSFDTGGSKETNCGNLYLVDSSNVEDIAKQIEVIFEHQLNSIDLKKVNKHTMAKEYYNMIL